MNRIAELLGEDIEAGNMWIGFIDAASSAPKIDHQKDLLLEVYAKYAPQIQDPRAMSRLAWVMYRLQEPAKAHPLLTRSVNANPHQPAIRKELASVLAALGRRAEAIQMLTVPEVLNSQDINKLLNPADLLTAENQPERAAKGFPVFWELFPIILPRSVRDQVYDPSHEELKEDYLKERARWQSPWARRWVTFSFTVRTIGLVGGSLRAALIGLSRKCLLAGLGLLLGLRVVSALRETIAEWISRLH